jgi:hypothetical protein
MVKIVYIGLGDDDIVLPRVARSAVQSHRLARCYDHQDVGTRCLDRSSRAEQPKLPMNILTPAYRESKPIDPRVIE